MKPTKTLTYFPLFLVLYEVAMYVSNDAYLPALPFMQHYLHTTNYLIQWSMTLFFLGNITTQLLLGVIADKYGYRRVLFSGGAMFVASTLLCTLSPSIDYLLIGRFFQGASITTMSIAGYATIHALYDQTKAIKTLAWMSSVTILAPAFGPLLGSLILLVASWRWVFFIPGLFGLCALYFLYRHMPEVSTKNTATSFKQMMYAYSHLIKTPSFIRPCLVLTLVFAAMIAWIAAGSFLVIDCFHQTGVQFGIIQAIIFSAFIVGSRLTSVSLTRKKWSLTQLTHASVLLSCSGSFLCLLLTMVSNNVWGFMGTMMLISLGAGVGFPVFNRLAIEGSSLPMGIKVAFFSFSTGFGAFLGSFLVSKFYTQTALSFAILITVLTAITLPIHFSLLAQQSEK